jgi:hypothetical protein
METLAQLYGRFKSHLLTIHSGQPWFAPALLLCLTALLLLTNPWFGLIDDEAYQVGSAAQPLSIVATQFKTDAAQLHPPLPDILLHSWLTLTENSLTLLRIPSILFFVLGIWICACTAKKVAGATAASATIILGVLWPYGFHFGRYAVWLPFCFFQLACVTWAYLRWLERPSFARLFWFVFTALALLYTNFMGWAFLAALGLDLLFRRELRSQTYWSQLAIAVVVLVAAYAPLWPQFLQLLEDHIPAISATIFLTFLYSLYVLVVSESIAPWVPGLSVPLILGLVVCSLVILFKAARFARLLYASMLVLALVLALSGEINQKRVMPLGAWLLISAGIALATIPPRWRRTLIFGFTVIGVVAWFGILSRRFYSTPRLFEPWQQIAQTAAASVYSHELVIGSHPAFLLYLTRDLMKAEGVSASHFHGNYGEQVQHPGVFHVADWIAAGHPTAPRVLFVASLYGTDFDSTMDAAAWLDRHCSCANSEKLVKNPQYELKSELFGPSQASPWRIEVSRFVCQGTPARPPISLGSESQQE